MDIIKLHVDFASRQIKSTKLIRIHQYNAAIDKIFHTLRQTISAYPRDAAIPSSSPQDTQPSQNPLRLHPSMYIHSYPKTKAI